MLCGNFNKFINNNDMIILHIVTSFLLSVIQDADKLFTWLLDPLPVNCKVIISSDSVFHAWQFVLVTYKIINTEHIIIESTYSLFKPGRYSEMV